MDNGHFLIIPGSVPVPRGELQAPDLQHSVHLSLVGRDVWLGTGFVLHALYPPHCLLQAAALQGIFFWGQYAVFPLDRLSLRSVVYLVLARCSTYRLCDIVILYVAVEETNDASLGQTSPGILHARDRGQAAAICGRQEYSSIWKRHLIPSVLESDSWTWHQHTHLPLRQQKYKTQACVKFTTVSTPHGLYCNALAWWTKDLIGDIDTPIQPSHAKAAPRSAFRPYVDKSPLFACCFCTIRLCLVLWM